MFLFKKQIKEEDSREYLDKINVMLSDISIYTPLPVINLKLAAQKGLSIASHSLTDGISVIQIKQIFRLFAHNCREGDPFPITRYH